MRDWKGRRGIAAALATACAAALAVPGAAPAAQQQAHLEGSRAVAPAGAPREVKQVIDAGNEIRHKPYVWGGGHRHWDSRGYDCSGAVSYVLHKAGLLGYPLDSTGFMRWGRKGRSGSIEIYANREHAYMVVAGLRWDTSYLTDGDRSGPGWSEQMRSSKGFRLRHPVGSRNW
jgi:hypothetical protein